MTEKEKIKNNEKANETYSINKFTGEYYFLSNFYNATVVYDEVEFQSVEVAYQAAKSLDRNIRYSMSKLNSSAAKKFGQTIKLRPDWEEKKYSIMYELCWQKFTRHKDLQKKLLDTCNSILIEGNNWNDTYWGICNGVGDNNLGKILMDIRHKLKNKDI